MDLSEKESREDNIKIVFEELKEKGLIKKDRTLKVSKWEHNFRAGLNKILYNPSYANLDTNTLRFFLLHEEGHIIRKGRSHLALFSGLCLAILFFIIVEIMLKIYLISIIVFFVVFLISFNILKPYFREDEFDADLWSCVRLKKYYRLSPSKEIENALKNTDNIRPKYHFINKLIYKLIKKLIIYHPSKEERINYIKSILG